MRMPAPRQPACPTPAPARPPLGGTSPDVRRLACAWPSAETVAANHWAVPIRRDAGAPRATTGGGTKEPPPRPALTPPIPNRKS